MTDGAGDAVELVARRLRELGLDHPAIDPAATAADLADRIAASASLDALVPGSGGLDPTAFDPAWPPEPADADAAVAERPN
ncbi:MAG: hypothetical protein F4011_13095 [Acidimicrobiaceae bacterium]|nr:hypothetical protein [Acidimicrobiaceae bacterium]MYG98073.1 hypothetical protein [Acidimicrobiaceae bacterium]MYL05101.1 hypothetical protein [Acidimicrobiaceae bacterium]